MSLSTLAQAPGAGGIAAAFQQRGKVIERFFMARIEIDRLAVGRLRIGGAPGGVVQHAEQTIGVGGVGMAGEVVAACRGGGFQFAAIGLRRDGGKLRACRGIAGHG